MKILTIGSASHTIRLECKEDLITRMHYSIGGGALASALAFKKLGCSVAACFRIGNDAEGLHIIENMQNHGILLHHTIDPKERTGTSFLIPYNATQLPALSHHGANAHLAHKDIPQEIFRGNDCIYISSLSGAAALQLPYLTSTARTTLEKKGIRVVVNIASGQIDHEPIVLKAALATIDILMMTTTSMKQFFSAIKPRFFQSTGTGLVADGPFLLRTVHTYKQITFTFSEYLNELFSYGLKRIVIFDNLEGVYVATPDTIYFHPSLNLATDSDAFGASFVTALLTGSPLEYAIRCGMLTTTSVSEKEVNLTLLKKYPLL